MQPYRAKHDDLEIVAYLQYYSISLLKFKFHIHLDGLNCCLTAKYDFSLKQPVWLAA